MWRVFYFQWKRATFGFSVTRLQLLSSQITLINGRILIKRFIVWKEKDSDQIWETENHLNELLRLTHAGWFLCSLLTYGGISIQYFNLAILSWTENCANLNGFWPHLRQLLLPFSQPNAPLTKWLQAWIHSNCNARCSCEPDKIIRAAIQTRQTLQSEPCQEVWMAGFIWQTSGWGWGEESDGGGNKTYGERILAL